MAAKAQWEGHLHALESFQVWKWSCSYLHVCPIPKADGTLCGQKHPAKAHKGASLNSGLCFEAPLEPLPGDFSAPALPMVLDVLAYGSAVSFKVFIFLGYIFGRYISCLSGCEKALCGHHRTCRLDFRVPLRPTGRKDVQQCPRRLGCSILLEK